MSEPPIDRQFDTAINLWLADENTLFKDDRGILTRFDTLWLKGPCAVLRYASEYLSKQEILPDQAREGLATLCNTPIDDPKSRDDLYRRALFLLGQVGLLAGQDDPGFLAHQLIQLTLGYAHAILAADAVVQNRWTIKSADPFPYAATHHALQALISFRQAWPLLKNTPVLPISGTPNQASPVAVDRSYDVIDAVVFQAGQTFDLKGDAEKIDASSWLIVRRLFWYLFRGPAASEPGHEERVTSFLTVGREHAECGTLKLSYSSEGQSAVYIDPVDTGLLLLDGEMLNSLLYGWLTCRSSLLGLGKQVILSLRITPQINCRFLKGNSAGGMFQVAMYATANGESLLDDATASFAIDICEDAKAKAERNDDLTCDDFVLKVVDHVTVLQKVKRAKGAGKRHVLFFNEQTDPWGNEFENWRPAAEHDNAGISIRGISTLAQATAFLTGNTKYEKVLEAYAEETAKEWEFKRPEPERPTRFIEPHYARLRDKGDLQDSSERAASHQEGSEQADSRERLLDEDVCNAITLRDGHQEEVGNQELTKLVKLAINDRNQKQSNPMLGARLILAEDANSGKTIFSYRLKHFFASKVGQAFFHGKPALIHRWENRDGSDNWPDCEQKHEAEAWLRRDLEKALKPFCEGTGAQPSEVVDYALKLQRIVLIFDAADQARNVNGLRRLLADNSAWKHCHAFITGRGFCFQQGGWASLIKTQAWTRATILGFDDNQKARYFNDVLPNDLRAASGDQEAFNSAFKNLFESYENIAELLEVPGMIELARARVEAERKRPGAQFERLTQLRTRADFYWGYYFRRLLPAIRERSGDINLEADEERYRMMLAVTAFRMALEDLTGLSAGGPALRKIKADVTAYCISFCHRFRTDLVWDTNENNPAKHWERLAPFGAFSDHGILEPHPDAWALSWRHKGWMEFFLGVFLANYADPVALNEFDFGNIPLNGPPIQADDEPGFRGISKSDYSDGASAECLFRDVMTQITNDPQWSWGWRMAAELPRVPGGGAIDRQSLVKSLGTLFLLPARGIRPTEQMYHAFYLFEQDELTPAGLTAEELQRCANLLPKAQVDAVLAEFRRPLQELLVPDMDDSTWSDERKKQRAVALDLMASFRPCPPPEWIERFEQLCVERERQGKKMTDEELWEANPCVFRQGSSYLDPDLQRRRQRIHITPFRMQESTVTRAQFRLFDSRFETPGGPFRDDNERWSGDDSKLQIIGDDCPIIMANWYDAFMFAKFLGADFRLPRESEWEFACRAGNDEPGDFFHCGDGLLDQRGNFDDKLRRTTPNKFYPANEFKLDQMHGNVREWCWDRFDPKYFEKFYSQSNDPPDLIEISNWGADRPAILRGCSWLDEADTTYGHSDLNWRDIFFGFRLVFCGR